MKTRPPTHPIRAWSRVIQGTLRVALAAAIAARSLAQQPAEPAKPVLPSSIGVELCKTNLNRIFEAIQEFQKANHTWPSYLSDLHPEFISDLNRFICPETLRNGTFVPQQPDLRIEVFEDPIPMTYTYEFKPKLYPLWAGIASTDLEFKLRQMKIIGSNVPIVRCMDHHQPGLDLSVGGTIFECKSRYWEDDREQLLPPSVFGDLAPTPGRFIDGIGPRDPTADPNLVDLSRHHTSAMHRAWLWRNAGNHLADLPRGTVQLDTVAVRFDARGVIQLTSKNMVSPFPSRVDGIALARKGRFLHFLEGAVLGEPVNKRRPPDALGTEIGFYRVHYADGDHLSIPIRYGRDVLEWDYAGDFLSTDGAKVAWEGKNRMSRANNRLLRLYHQRWENPRPENAIASIDFVSSMAGVAPFLIAVTLEP